MAALAFCEEGAKLGRVSFLLLSLPSLPYLLALPTFPAIPFFCSPRPLFHALSLPFWLKGLLRKQCELPQWLQHLCNILSPGNMSGDNKIGFFCIDQNVVISCYYKPARRHAFVVGGPILFPLICQCLTLGFLLGHCYSNMGTAVWEHCRGSIASFSEVSRDGCYCPLLGVFCVLLVIAQACAVLPTSLLMIKRFAHCTLLVLP